MPLFLGEKHLFSLSGFHASKEKIECLPKANDEIRYAKPKVHYGLVSTAAFYRPPVRHLPSMSHLWFLGLYLYRYMLLY